MNQSIDWEICQYPKNQIRKATKQLIQNNIDTGQKIEAYRILAKFRSAHAYPIQSMMGYFRTKALAIDKKAIIARRLKRIPSILNKLKRFPSMQVDRMGDIGGARIVVRDIHKVCRLRDALSKGSTRNKLLSEKNYLEQPKTSGYRSIHLTYAYLGSKSAYQNYKIELQIRSQIQHAWATAVEVVGTFTKQALKADTGDKAWLDFFAQASLAFAALEQKETIAPELRQSIADYVQRLKVRETMFSFTTLSNSLPKERGKAYLLRLNISEGKIYVQTYSQDFLFNVYEDYRRLETELAEDENQDVVLVSSESIKDLKKAYPNYFADTQLFLAVLDKILKRDG